MNQGSLLDESPRSGAALSDCGRCRYALWRVWGIGQEIKMRVPEIMTHTKECQERNERIARERAAWEAAHPKHCKTCNGNGLSVSRGSSVPYGATFVSLPDDVDPCSDCTEQGRCPWCGVELIDESRCSRDDCGWHDELAPPPSEGDCWCDFETPEG